MAIMLRNKNKHPHWHELLMPTLLLGGAWMIVSAATTVYILWLDDFHQQVLTDNVTSIRAAARMQYALWQFRSAPIGSSKETELINEFRGALTLATLSASTVEEQVLVASIDKRFKALLNRNDQGVLQDGTLATEVFNEVASDCEKYRKVNVQLMDDALSNYNTWFPSIAWIRFTAVILGPLGGVWLGYRMASRFRDRIAAINVSLDGTASELGAVQLTSKTREGDLDELDRQVQTVAIRFQKMVSQLDDARREATRNERLAAIGHLAAGVAHEIRNPLTAVKLLVQNASHRASNGSWNADQLAVIREEIARIERTIQDLLDFARPASSQQVLHDVCETLRRAVRLVQGRAEQHGMQIELIADHQPIFVLGDPEQLHQVFVNLFMNGMDAMTNGGKLFIRVDCAAGHLKKLGHVPGTPTKIAGAAGDMCRIVVQDNGAGIPPELLGTIFEPFITSKARGTGLGLAISRQIVEAHGGRLTAANRLAGGAEFVITLPMNNEESAKAEGVREAVSP